MKQFKGSKCDPTLTYNIYMCRFMQFIMSASLFRFLCSFLLNKNSYNKMLKSRNKEFNTSIQKGKKTAEKLLNRMIE